MLRKHTLSAPARSTEHLRWLPAKSNRCAASAACLGRSPKVAAETAAEGKFLTDLHCDFAQVMSLEHQFQNQTL